MLALHAADVPAQVGAEAPYREPHVMTEGESRLRGLLADYDAGNIEGAIRALSEGPKDWAAAGLDLTLDRIEADLKYHRRPANRVSAADDDRLIGALRAERVHLLVLYAGLRLDASTRADTLAAAARHLNASETAVDRLYGLRADFKADGPVPWPVVVAGGARRHPAPVAPTTPADWPVVLAYVERWYAAAVARLQAAVEVTVQPVLLAKGLQRLPGSHDLLLARGTFVETQVALSRPEPAPTSELESTDDRRQWRERLKTAERDYQRASELARDDAEALVRLGHVRLTLGRVDAARALLTEALGRGLSTRTRYLALLFRARAARAAGDATAAAADYRAALAAYAGATTPMLALATMADERGDATASREWVARALASPLGLDPWRAYTQGQAWQLAARLDAVRRLRR